VISKLIFQVKESKDFALWRETLDSERTFSQDKLITGPMWSGCSSLEKGDPLKVSMEFLLKYKFTW
jgi:hypothetical protein